MHRHITDRSNLDEVVSIRWALDGSRQGVTRRESLQAAGMPRSEIVLFNGCRSGKEYALYVCYEGFAGDTWLLDVLTDEEHAQVMGIAERMRANVAEYGPAWKLLGEGWKG